MVVAQQVGVPALISRESEIRGPQTQHYDNLENLEVLENGFQGFFIFMGGLGLPSQFSSVSQLWM